MKQFISRHKLSQMFFWLFLVVLPFNKRVIYNPQHAYIDGYFSYYLAFFVYLSDIVLFLCLVSYATENWNRIPWPNFRNWPKSPIFWLILAFIWPMFHVQHDFWATYSVLKIFEFVALGAFVAKNLENLNIRLIAWIFTVSGIFQAILAILQFHVQHSLGLGFLGEYVADLGTGGLATLDTVTGKVIRAYGTFPHPNILAGFLVFALALGIFLMVSRETSKKAQYFFFVGEFLLILGIFVTFSRIAWISAFFVVLGFLLYKIKSEKWLRLAIFLPAMAAGIVIFAFFHNLILNRVQTIEGSNSYIQRVALNNEGFKIWGEHLLLGTGVGNYIPTMMNVFHVQPWEYQPSHNIFIFLGASLGIVGFLAFLWLLLKILKGVWTAPQSDLRFTLLLIFAVIIFMSNFDHFLVTIQQGQLMFAGLLGLMAGIAKLKKTV